MIPDALVGEPKRHTLHEIEEAMTENTLKITFGEADDHRDAARERLRRAESGATGSEIEQDVRFVLNFEEYAEVERLMRQSNLELLWVIEFLSEGSGKRPVLRTETEQIDFSFRFGAADASSSVEAADG